MWYEILPALGGMFAGLVFGTVMVPVCHYVHWGTPMSRHYNGDRFSISHIRRDNKITEHFTGKTFSCNYAWGLEALEDDDNETLTYEETQKRKTDYFLF